MLLFSLIFVVFVDTFDDMHEAQYSRLSLDIKEELPGLPYADLIEKGAVQLLNSPSAIVNAPSVFEQKSKHYLVAGKEKNPYDVKLLSSGLVTCNCREFQFVKICKHSAAIAEKEQVLKILLSKSKASQRAKLQKQSSGDILA